MRNPQVAITRVGRWTHLVIADFPGEVRGAWRVLGYHRAERKALRMLAKYRQGAREAGRVAP